LKREDAAIDMALTSWGNEFVPGDRVRYVPHHARGDITHPDCEDGTVKRCGKHPGVVFVIYDNDLPHATAKGCAPEALVRIDPTMTDLSATRESSGVHSNE
jgi:hypothetical protein